MLKENLRNELEIFATQIRLETVKEFKARGFGHVGGSMSICDVLAVLYGKIMNVNPKNPRWEDRDWFVLSKGHAGPALYATLALKGYFPLEILKTLNQPRTMLPSHCDRNRTPGVDMTTGSLGQGISTAIGVAVGNRIDERKSYVYFILGDGECDEGQIWEGALFAAHNKLNHVIGFVDANKQQLDGYTKDVNDLGDIAEKFACFGWYVQNIDGSNVEQIYEAIQKAKEQNNKPSMIVLNTIKGQGCCFAENTLKNHHIEVSQEQADEAICILERTLSEQINS